ncbi:MAG: glycosyltransferase family 4 protein [Bacteroidota bacterium]
MRYQAEILSKNYKVIVLHTIAKSDAKKIDINQTETENFTEIIVHFPQGSNFVTRKTNRIQAFKKGLDLVPTPDVIHAHVTLPGIYLFKIAKDFFKCPLVLTEHSSMYWDKNAKSMSLKDRFFLRLARQHVDQFVAVSDFLQKDLIRFFSAEKIVVVGNPVNTDLFLPGKERKKEFTNFLHVSTLDKNTKNIDGILDAVALMLQKGYEEIQLKIISDEPLEDVREKVAAKGLNRHVVLAGPMQPGELLPHFQQSSAFVLFSLYETFSLVVVEAWATGLPVISTNVGVAEAMPANVGYNVKSDDPLSLAMAMEKIINENNFDAHEIRAHALTFSSTAFLDAIEKVYQRVLS